MLCLAVTVASLILFVWPSQETILLRPTMDGEAKYMASAVSAFSAVTLPNNSCAFTFIGPRVAVTAGHCAKTKMFQRDKFAGPCQRLQVGTKEKWTTDIAVCVSTEGEWPPPYEVVAESDDVVALGDSVYITGYYQGEFTSGLSIIKAVPTRDDDMFVTGVTTWQTLSDSGCPVFTSLDAKTRRLLAVSSWGGGDKESRSQSVQSLRSLIKEWIDKPDQSFSKLVCGFNLNSSQCR